MTERTIFEKIAAREIPADIVWEDEHCLAFRDINPQAPVHLLLVPRKPIPSLQEASPDDLPLLGHLWLAVQKIAIQEQLDRGYRVVANFGRDGGQEVPHVHLHILAGRGLKWPPG